MWTRAAILCGRIARFKNVFDRRAPENTNFRLLALKYAWISIFELILLRSLFRLWFSDVTLSLCTISVMIAYLLNCSNSWLTQTRDRNHHKSNRWFNQHWVHEQCRPTHVQISLKSLAYSDVFLIKAHLLQTIGAQTIFQCKLLWQMNLMSKINIHCVRWKQKSNFQKRLK